MKRKNIMTRRTAIATGLASLGGLILNGCTTQSPPTYGNILRMGDAFTYLAHRTLLPGQSLVKEYSFSDISSFPATGTINPAQEGAPGYNADYEKLWKNNFSDWRLTITGSVERPASFSLDDLKRLPIQSQITRHTCEEGWTAIAQWNGVPLGMLLQTVGIKPSSRFVNFYSYDGWQDGLDLIDAFHPQTILAYGMNGKELKVAHGAPLRLRLERQIGYKSMKYLSKIEVTDNYIDVGDFGWAWYTGI